MNVGIDDIIIDSQSVKDCWLKIKSARGVDYFVTDFYKHLFTQHPEIQQLFPDDLRIQKSKLLNMLDNVINGVEYLDDIKPLLVEMGSQHKDRGVNREMYDIFIVAAVEAAKSSSDFNVSNTEIRAWENAFRVMSNIMLSDCDS